MTNKEQLRKSLPHGSLSKIAFKAGVTKNSVTKFFNNTIKSSPLIEKAALECALEYEKGKSNLIAELKELL